MRIRLLAPWARPGCVYQTGVVLDTDARGFFAVSTEQAKTLVDLGRARREPVASAPTTERPVWKRLE